LAGEARAHLRDVTASGQDYAFAEVPGLFERAYVLEYSTGVPFEEAVHAVEEALHKADLHKDSLVVHAHSMGGLVAAQVFAGSSPLAVFCYDAPFGGLHWLVAKTIREASKGADPGVCVRAVVPMPVTSCALPCRCLTARA
jgi:hypothetical protein